MSRFHKFDYALIMVYRNIRIEALDTLDICIDKLSSSPITDEERHFVQYFKSYMTHPYILNVTQSYDLFSPHELVLYLTSRNIHHFPIPVQFIKKGEEKLCIIIYYMLRNMKIERNIRTWSDEQLQAINSDSRFTIINAGPGTGKSSSMNERLYRLYSEKKEGVILVSYTNSAINENFERLFEYPGMYCNMIKKEYRKPVVVTTIDSIAGYICSTVGKMSYQAHSVFENIKQIKETNHVNYEESIKRAYNLAKTQPEKLREKLETYKHIIIDEAQDVDLLRAALVFELVYQGVFKTCIIAGDPKQRLNDKAGDWFVNLWTSKTDPVGNPVEITKIGYSTSYRFKTQLMLDLSNSLSSRRPTIHHELKFPPNFKPEFSDKIDYRILPYNIVNDNELNRFADELITLNKNEKIPFSQMLIAGPSLFKENKTAGFIMKLITVLTKNKIPCFADTEGSYRPDGIQVATVNACKGKEFDVVILVGFGDYPNTFTMIPYDSAESQIYVVHTRARKRIYHLLHMPKLPRGLDSKFMVPHFAEVEANHKLAESEKEEKIEEKNTSNSKLNVSDLAKDFGFSEFITTNKFAYTYKDYTLSTPLISKFPARTNPRWWGIAVQTGICMYTLGQYPKIFQEFTRKNYMVVSNQEYIEMVRRNEIINGYDVERGSYVVPRSVVNGVTEDERQRCQILSTKHPFTLTWDDFVFIVMICDFFYSGHMLSRYEIQNPDMPADIFKNFMEIGKTLNAKFGNAAGDEFPVNFKTSYAMIAGKIDILFARNSNDITFLEIKTVDREFKDSDRYQTLLYYLLGKMGLPVTTKITAILYNPLNGKFEEIATNNNLERWNYILKAYLQLACHVSFTERHITDIQNTREKQQKEKEEKEKQQKEKEQKEKEQKEKEEKEKEKSSESSMSTSSTQINSSKSNEVIAKADAETETKIVLKELDVRMQDHNAYFVDTEFLQLGNNNAEIFDIAIVNAKHPFKSIVTTLNVSEKTIAFGSNWLKLDREIFGVSPHINEIFEMFRELTKLYIQNPKIYAYNSNVDFCWIDSDKLSIQKINLAGEAKKIAEQNGCFASSAPCPKLGDLYGSKVVPLMLNPHLEAHTALSDSLMLYTLFKLDILK